MCKIPWLVWQIYGELFVRIWKAIVSKEPPSHRCSCPEVITNGLELSPSGRMETSGDHRLHTVYVHRSKDHRGFESISAAVLELPHENKPLTLKLQCCHRMPRTKG
ncbi:hypothetical protein HRI_003049500 [Hibiscus trionum]|uniref:Uncharacterized protein n=1 Tax=Hibiscus trionum TaxID=183268 RepID=A0A9W7IEN8_HIBTR|nr:hypothetical protein HRI_003049500 [Hibiscus trionum]